ncbi:S1 RNA-binding domain-containing protein [Patescibacteria group bacterium]|nr:S1 RNA-binding domain-containing protein [Patescibacteria group bacterium]
MTEEQTTQQTTSMKDLLEQEGLEVKIYQTGDVVKGRVIDVSQNRVWLDVGGKSLGVIPKRELLEEKNLKNIEINEELCTFVLAPENDDGYAVLSLKRAIREQAWEELATKFEKEQTIKVKVVEANKGGLLVDIHGIRGFLPVSQLKPENYPRVDGGNKEEIREKLSKFVGTDMQVRIIAFERATNKLIFSEKAVPDAKQKEIEQNYKVGDAVEGVISGVVDFGAFMKFDGVEGLIHISEITWGRVDKIEDFLKIGEKTQAMLIGLDNGRISLSIKRLLADPWVKMMQKYEVGDMVDGEVSKITPFGAFATIDNTIDGLVHISELSSKRVVNPAEVVKVGEKHKFKIISIEPDNHRLGLSLKAVTEPDVVPAEEEKDKEEKKEAKKEVVKVEKGEKKEKDKERVGDLTKVDGISKKIADNLTKAGIDSVEKLRNLKKEELTAVEGIGEKTAEKIMKAVG